MVPSLVLSQLLDLPPAFSRPGTTFQQIYSSLAAGESSYALASDGLKYSESMPTSLAGWLAVWGEILGIPKNPGESDFFYTIRVQATLMAPVGTPSGIETWSRFILGIQGIYVVESLTTGGYNISVPIGTPIQAFTNWASSLNRIRPAGVPFTVNEQTNPLMLGTYSYIGSLGFAGSYLGTGGSVLPIMIPESTNNAQPLASEVLLVDPLLNGKVTLGFAY